MKRKGEKKGEKERKEKGGEGDVRKKKRALLAFAGVLSDEGRVNVCFSLFTLPSVCEDACFLSGGI